MEAAEAVTVALPVRQDLPSTCIYLRFVTLYILSETKTKFVSWSARKSRLNHGCWWIPNYTRELFCLVFQYYQRKACSYCNHIPNEGSICLVCGTLVCFKQSCCKREKIHEATQVSSILHLFMVSSFIVSYWQRDLYRSTLTIVEPVRLCFWLWRRHVWSWCAVNEPAYGVLCIWTCSAKKIVIWSESNKFSIITGKKKIRVLSRRFLRIFASGPMCMIGNTKNTKHGDFYRVPILSFEFQMWISEGSVIGFRFSWENIPPIHAKISKVVTRSCVN